MASGAWADERGSNLLDGGAPFYSVYETADGRHMAVGAIEAPFYAALVAGLGIDVDPARQHDRSTWQELRATIATAFRSRTQADWIDIFAATDACVSPVRSLHEAAADAHLAERGAVTVAAGQLQAGRAPRFSGHALVAPDSAPEPGQHTDEVLDDWWRPPGDKIEFI